MSDMFGIIFDSGVVAKIVLLILLILSIISWGVIFEKLRLFYKLNGETRKFLLFFENKPGWSELFTFSRNFKTSPFPKIIMRIYTEFRNWSQQTSGEDNIAATVGNPSTVKKRPIAFAPLIDSTISKEMSILEKRLILLSTTVSVSPFLGLLGTVWGIMSAFLSMGTKGAADITTVGPGIAEALITTAAGLGVAIPALLAYNFFIDKLRRLSDELEVFSSDLLQLVERHKSP
jgi:biopolymer transport protein TolQ